MVGAPTLIVVMSLRLAIPWWVALQQSPPPLHQPGENLFQREAVVQRILSGTFLREATNQRSGTFLREATGQGLAQKIPFLRARRIVSATREVAEGFAVSQSVVF